MILKRAADYIRRLSEEERALERGISVLKREQQRLMSVSLCGVGMATEEEEDEEEENMRQARAGGKRAGLEAETSLMDVWGLHLE